MPNNDNEYWALMLLGGVVQLQEIKNNRWRDIPPEAEILFIGKSVLSAERWLKRSVELVAGQGESGMTTLNGVDL
jgi:hypothetical protein